MTMHSQRWVSRRGFSGIGLGLLLGLWMLCSGSGCIVVTGWNSPSHWVETSEEFSVSCDEIEEIRARTHNGFIEIEGTDADTDEILVHATIKAGGRSHEDADQCLDSVVIDATRSNGVQRLGWHWNPDRQRGWGATVNFVVSVPRDIAVDSESHNGRLKISRISGPVRVMTHNGRVILTDVSGTVHGESHNGPMKIRVATDEVELLTHNGSIEALLESFGPLSGSIETHNGGVRVDFAGNPSTKLSCRTHNGSIKTSGLELDSPHRTKRSLKGGIGRGSRGALKVETHNGSIRVGDAGIDRTY